jgi:biopolymer transport protein ExbD
VKKNRIPPHKQDPFEEATINLTPLIDVVFVVLIIFIIIAPMLELDRVNLASATPSTHEQTPCNNTNIAIHVHKDNSIWYNGNRVTIETLTLILKHLKQQPTGEQIPQLFQDKEAYFGTYQNIKNAAEIAGFKQMDVILKPE